MSPGEQQNPFCLRVRYGQTGVAGLDVVDLNRQGDMACVGAVLNGQSALGRLRCGVLRAQLHEINHWWSRRGPPIRDLGQTSNLLKHFQ